MKRFQPARSVCAIAAAACLLIGANPAIAGEADVLEVQAAGTAMPIAVDMPKAIGAKIGSSQELVEIDGAEPLHITAQLVPAAADDGTIIEGSQQLLAIIPADRSKAEVRRFRLQESQNGAADRFCFEAVSDASLGLWQGEDCVLVYNHQDIVGEHLPEDNPQRRRACYLHPVWGLSGEEMTEDFPHDHPHLHGISWAWPHIKIGDEEYDLWFYENIQQRFIKWIYRETGPVAAVLAVENGWFVGERKVMIERVWMRVFQANQGRRALDITLTLIPVDRDITLRGAEDKGYGGLTMFFGPHQQDQSVITVPTGRTQEDLLIAPLAWADYTSKFAGSEALSGATIMIDPAHPGQPSSWLTRHYGGLFAGYPGVLDKTFTVGKPVTLNYRISLHGTSAQLIDLQQVYEAYTSALQASWSQ